MPGRPIIAIACAAFGMVAWVIIAVAALIVWAIFDMVRFLKEKGPNA